MLNLLIMFFEPDPYMSLCIFAYTSLFSLNNSCVHLLGYCHYFRAKAGHSLLSKLVFLDHEDIQNLFPIKPQTSQNYYSRHYALHGTKYFFLLLIGMVQNT